MPTNKRPGAYHAKAIADWSFRGTESGLVWEGYVAGPDRLRFLGVLARYAALLAGISMQEDDAQRDRKVAPNV